MGNGGGDGGEEGDPQGETGDSTVAASPRTVNLEKRRRRRKSGDDHHGHGSSFGDGGKKAESLRQRYRSMWTRTRSTVYMLLGFSGIVYAGHVFIWLLIIGLQFLMVRELFSLSNRAQRHRNPLPGFTVLNWHFFFTAMLYVYGRFMHKQLMVSFTSTPAFASVRLLAAALIRYHPLVCYTLYISGFVWFILSLRKGQYQFQFGQYAWSHMILFVVFFQSSFFVYNVFQGIIWFLLPCSLIIINDCAAYLFGFYFGRTPLIKLSPKKTWEGFMGASATTIVSAFLLAGAMGHFEWLTCPRKDLSIGPLHCDPGPMFEQIPYYLPFPFSKALGVPQTVLMMPVQRHALLFGLFASSIAPFGGFFASGFKRAFKIKDFGDSIPGHGGITDRMDCQMVMAVFSYIYYQSFIAQHSPSVDYVLSKAMSLDEHELLELHQRIGSILSG